MAESAADKAGEQLVTDCRRASREKEVAPTSNQLGPCCTRKREYRKSDLGSLGYLAHHDSRCPDRLAPVDRCPSGSAVSRRHFAGSRLSAERIDVKRVDPMRLSEFERKLSR